MSLSVPVIDSSASTYGDTGSISITYTLDATSIANTRTVRLIVDHVTDISVKQIYYTLHKNATTFTTPSDLTNGEGYVLCIQQILNSGQVLKSAVSSTVTPVLNAVPLTPILSDDVAVGDSAISFTFDSGETQGSNLTTIIVTKSAHDISNNLVVSNEVYSFANSEHSTADIVVTTVGTNHTIVLKNLTNGSSYDLGLNTANEFGMSATLDLGILVPADVPTAPVNITALVANGEITLTWTKPTVFHEDSIASYNIKVIDNDLNETILSYTNIDETNATTDSFVVTNANAELVNGSSFTLSVSVIMTYGGESNYSSTITKIPFVAASAVLSMAATPGNTQVSLAWDALTTLALGGMSLVKYEVSSDGGSSYVSAGTALSYVFENLTNGITYTFVIRGVTLDTNGLDSANAGAGDTEVSGATVSLTKIPFTTPAASTNFEITVGNGSADLSWDAYTTEDLGGLPFKKYRVVRNGDGYDSSDTSFSFTGLTNGTEYLFRVMLIALNVNGADNVNSGSGTADSTGTSVSRRKMPFAPPSNPRSVAVERDAGDDILTWVASADNGGFPIARYEVGFTSILDRANAEVIDATTYTHDIAEDRLELTHTYDLYAVVLDKNGSPGVDYDSESDGVAVYSSNPVDVMSVAYVAPTINSVTCNTTLITANINDNGSSLISLSYVYYSANHNSPRASDVYLITNENATSTYNNDGTITLQFDHTFNGAPFSTWMFLTVATRGGIDTSSKITVS